MAESARSSRRIHVRELLITAVEFVFLLGLWMLFVSLPEINELVAGLAAAFLAAAADAVVKATEFARFRPRFAQVLLIFIEPWYVAKDTLVIFWELLRRIAGKPRRSRLTVIPFKGGDNSLDGSARRALAVAYTSISPNTIVLGIDRKRNFLLLHQIVPAGTTWLTKQLGAR